MTKQNIPEICKVLILSTAHIKPQTAKLINSKDFPIAVYEKKGYGWFISLDMFDKESPQLPDDLNRIINYAIFIGCDWLCLDRDANVYNELPVYEW